MFVTLEIREAFLAATYSRVDSEDSAGAPWTWGKIRKSHTTTYVSSPVRGLIHPPARGARSGMHHPLVITLPQLGAAWLGSAQLGPAWFGLAQIAAPRLYGSARPTFAPRRPAWCSLTQPG